MEIQTSKDPKAFVVTVKGSMDAVSAPRFEASFGEWLNQGEKQFIVDVSGLEYISSAGLRGILASAKKTKAQGGKIVFCGLAGMVKEVFDISYFTSMFPIFPDVQGALAQI